jgi:hypothetical protein
VEPETAEKVQVTITDEEKARQARINARPPLDEILSLHDFEVRIFIFGLATHYLSLIMKAIGRQVMPEKAWAYYSSSAGTLRHYINDTVLPHVTTSQMTKSPSERTTQHTTGQSHSSPSFFALLT